MSGARKPVPSLVTLEALATALNERGVSLAMIPPRMTGLGSIDATGAVLPVFGVAVERAHRGRVLGFSAQGFSLEAAIRDVLQRFDDEWRGIIVAEAAERKQRYQRSSEPDEGPTGVDIDPPDWRG